MDELIKKRGRLKARLTRIYNFVEQGESGAFTKMDVNVRLDLLTEVWSEFEAIQTKIECTCIDDELASQEQEQEEFEIRFCAIKAKLLQLQDNSNNALDYQVRPSELRTQVKLPAIELPSFSGDFKQWKSFEDLFQSVVHTNTTITSVQKLHYLKLAVKGEAARLLSSIAITEANYLEAWKILRDRYSNKKQVVQSHLKALYEQPKLATERATDIRRLLDITVENLRALHALGLPTEEWDCLMIFLVTERLDSNTRRHWELTMGDHEDPSFEDFKDFLEKRCRALEAAGPEKETKVIPTRTLSRGSGAKTATSYFVTPASCAKCKAQHALYRCESFLHLSTDERIKFVRSASLCYNCLRVGHTAKECKSSLCKKCQLRHNTVLHREAKDAPILDKDNTVVSTHSRGEPSYTQILLATALVNIPDSKGVYQSVRALLDSGSQASFVSEACAERLGLKRQRANVTVGGLGTTDVGTCKSAMQLHIHSMHTTYKCQVLALILPRVTGTIPLQPVDQSSLFNIIRDYHLNLADPHYHRPGQVDLLLGAEVYYELLLSGSVKETGSSTIFQNTNLGWVISGSVPTTYNHITVSAHLGTQELDLQLRAFWEIENSVGRQLTTEELRCEEHFKETYTRNEKGRFIVRLPFRDNLANLGHTGSIATHRLIQMERRLENNATYKSDYHAFMEEYLSLHHMEEIGDSDGDTRHYHLPHHFVIKESSSTTRMRVVFDGTVKPTTGLSLNETLMVGPVVHDELLDILTRFRMHNIVFIADIEKMYRQILIHPDDRKYQRIKWRTSSAMAVMDYQLTTVTYGTACAPFLATRCLQELAILGESSHPLAAEVIKQDFYVDDLMSGANTVQDAMQIQTQLNDLLFSGGMQLRKWASNNAYLMENLPEHLRNCETTLDITQGTIKTLGIQWQPNLDQFVFKVSLNSPGIISKRSVLSQISRLFDPLGWLSPVIVRAKIMIQRLWLLGIGWDEQLPATLALEWKQFHSELRILEQLSIPRQMIGDSATTDFQLHGFCDASEVAFGAVIFLRSIKNHQPTIRLVCSKSKVAPLRKISLPRLELCGAVVLARLMSRMRITLNLQSEVYMWTDSTVVLAWLRKPPFYWKTFIANRITEIQDLVSPDHWRHVISEENPADCLSRGLSPQQLLNNSLWWSGPEWLSHEAGWPLNEAPPNDHLIAEAEHRKPSLQSHMAITQVLFSITDYSSLSKLIRITSYCRRFVSNCKVRHTRNLGFLTTVELQEGLQYWIAVSQAETFKREVHNLHANQPVSNKSVLQPLNPFIDSHGLLRVGGRLQQSLLPYDQKHPLILPTNHALTTLIVRHEHVRNLHAGPRLLQAILGRKYWIIRVKKLINHVIHKCVRCFRLRMVTSQQLMGELPHERIVPSRVFSHCGIDYAGPLLLKLTKGRGNGRTHKAYICIFICFATKAIHIELINDLSTPSFIAGLRRFVARRGRPLHIYSDCGTNFIGADHYLREFHHLIASSDHNQQVFNTLSQDGINWHFNPPSAPHFGGLWEAGVKSIKYHLRRIVGNVSLTYEEMYTVLTQIESCLNSRPLCPMTTDPDDLGVLTPGHFLIGDALIAAPDQDVTDVSLNRLSRWELVQRLYQHFWKRWSTEYLSRLQQRPKWMTARPNIAVGDLVLIKETQSSPLQWPMARITCVHPGPDGLVRVVTLKTANGPLKRPLSKCCLLPIDRSNIP